MYNVEKTDGKYKSLIKYQRLDYLRKFCRKSTTKQFLFPDINNIKFQHLTTITLIIVFNRPHHYNIPLLQLLYEPWFKKVVYCSTFSNYPFDVPNFIVPFIHDEKFSYINVSLRDFQSGFFSYQCVMKYIQSNPDQESNYLIIADDLLLNFWNSFGLDIVHLHNSCNRVVDGSGNSGIWWNSPYGETALIKVMQNLNDTKNLLGDILSPKEMDHLFKSLMEPIWCPSDIYYLPSKMADKFKKLAELFLSCKVFLEFAIPKVLSVLGWYKHYIGTEKNQVDISGKYLWNMSARASPFVYYNKNELFIHPVKFTLLQTIKTEFCDTYVFDLFKSLSEI